MGYTHYFETKEEISLNTWKNYFMPAVKTILMEANTQGIPTAGPAGEASTIPEFADDRIMFNGVGEDAHETMVIHRTPIEFDFCKTNRKPYDAVCVAVSVLAKALFRSEFDWKSDGMDELDFDREGKELLKSALEIKSDSGINRTNIMDKVDNLVHVW